jgi:alpha-beta hydrolase superfamily lysophospholipase
MTSRKLLARRAVIRTVNSKSQLENNMITFEANLKSKDGIEFFVRGWEPEIKSKAIVALVHGLGEHTGRYEHIAQAMTDAGYTLVGFDLRGHGKSGGVRGHFPSLDAVMQDIKDFFAFLTTRYPELPQFLYGHSLGGLLVLTYVLKNKPKLKGVIATGAGLRSPIHQQKMKILMAKVLGSLAPSAQIASGLETAAISHDPKIVDAYLHDPLVHNRISLGFGKTGLNATDYVWSHAEEFSVPLLIMHGSADRITYSHGSADFSRLAAKNNTDITLKLWEGMYHEVHNEPEKKQVIQFMIDWLDRHL